jgi:hypothetical protein
MVIATVNVTARTRWWLKPYVRALVLANAWFGFVPSDAHVERVANLATKIRIGELQCH